MNDRKEELENLINQLVVPKGFPCPSNLDLKIDILSFVLEYVKYHRAETEALSFEQFTQCDLQVQGGKLWASAPTTFRDIGTGTRPIRLQASLLLFLLLHHRERHQVLDIINLFVEQIRSNLSFIDFKKTRTGVTRCFTNTRFAAHTLRDYGLLKFTRREAFKTWELSLSGFLVAADILAKRSATQSAWELPLVDKNSKLDLAPEIYLATRGLDHFDIFLDRLTSICQPDASVFRSFGPALNVGFEMLKSYWPILRDQSKTHEERRSASLARIQKLDALGEDFFHELSRCIQINDLLKRTIQSGSR